MKHKHLTLDDRIRIEHFLEENRSIRYIAERLDRPPSTISREINKHAIVFKGKKCNCVNFKSCDLKHVCGSLNCNKSCRNCNQAKKYCTDHTPAYCDILLANRSNVCNFCDKRHHCFYEHKIYEPSKANKQYKETLTNCRNGYDCTAEEIIAIDETVSPLIKKGQSIYHIMRAHKEDIPISESTLRRMIHDCELDARNIDMRSVVQRKVRKHNDNSYKKSVLSKKGHLYEDYLDYINKHDDVMTVQMDCVEGSKDSSTVLLTLHYPQIHLQLAMILNSQTSENVVYALDIIEESLGTELFKVCFPLILTDNGHEFEDIEGIERSVSGGKRTKVFYCEPNRSDEKGSCENNHKFIRYVIPKGVSMDNLMQSHITLMMNHINSYARSSLFGKTPYDVAMAVMPEDFFILLGLEKIPSDDVFLRPDLLPISVPSKAV